MVHNRPLINGGDSVCDIIPKHDSAIVNSLLLRERWRDLRSANKSAVTAYQDCHVHKQVSRGTTPSIPLLAAVSISLSGNSADACKVREITIPIR